MDTITPSLTTIMTNQELLGTFSIIPLVRDLLGDSYSRPISFETAEVLIYHCKNEHLCHIQMPQPGEVDITGKPITHPILWEIGQWRISTEKWLRAANRSEQERQERAVYDQNIKIVAYALYKTLGFSPDQSRILAHRLLREKDFNRIKALGVPKLYTNYNEIPAN